MQNAFRNLSGQAVFIPTMMGTWNSWGGTTRAVQPTTTPRCSSATGTRNATAARSARATTPARPTTPRPAVRPRQRLHAGTEGYSEETPAAFDCFTRPGPRIARAQPVLEQRRADLAAELGLVHRWGDIAPMVEFIPQRTTRRRTTGWPATPADRVQPRQRDFNAVEQHDRRYRRTRSTQTCRPAFCNIVHGLANTGGATCASDSVTVNSSGNATILVAADGGFDRAGGLTIYAGQMITGSGGGSGEHRFDDLRRDVPAISNASTSDVTRICTWSATRRR